MSFPGPPFAPTGGVLVAPLRCSLGALRVEIGPGRAATDPGTEERIAAAWRRMTGANPRLFNGPILSVRGFDPAPDGRPGGVLHAAVDEYRRLAVQPEVPTGTRQLSVTGLLVARDSGGREHVCLGRRSHQTRMYGGLWELAPSGGVDPPGAGAGSLGGEDLWRALVREIEEELALPATPEPVEIVALIADPASFSVDALVRAEVPMPAESLIARARGASSHERWEYESVRWVPLADLLAFIAAEPVIPPLAAAAALV